MGFLCYWFSQKELIMKFLLFFSGNLLFAAVYDLMFYVSLCCMLTTVISDTLLMVFRGPVSSDTWPHRNMWNRDIGSYVCLSGYWFICEAVLLWLILLWNMAIVLYVIPLNIRNVVLCFMANFKQPLAYLIQVVVCIK